MVASRPRSAPSSGLFAPGTFRTAGTALGAYLGGPAGASFGGAAGDILSRIVGSGEYKLEGNTIAKGQAVPSFSKDGDGIRVCHREYFSDCAGWNSGMFAWGFGTISQQAISINPANNKMFPWLSGLAVQFEEWEPNGIVVQYRPTSAAYNGSNQQLGVVMLATQYNLNDVAFANKVQVDSYEYSSSTVPYEGMMHGIECSAKNSVMRSYFCWPSIGGGTPTGTTPVATASMYDIGKLSAFTSGVNGTPVLGEFWVSYDITFRKPRITTSPITSAIHLAETPAASCTATNRLGTTIGTNVKMNNLSSAEVSVPSTNTLIFSKIGSYRIHASWYTANNNIAASPVFTYGSNFTELSHLLNGRNPQLQAFNAAGAIAFITAIVQVTANGSGAANTLTITGLTGMTGGECDFFISQHVPDYTGVLTSLSLNIY